MNELLSPSLCKGMTFAIRIWRGTNPVSNDIFISFFSGSARKGIESLSNVLLTKSLPEELLFLSSLTISSSCFVLTGNNLKVVSIFSPKYFEKWLLVNCDWSILSASSWPIELKNLLNPFTISFGLEVEVTGGDAVEEAKGSEKVEGSEVEDLALPVTSLINDHVRLGSLIDSLNKFK